jgi:hypothetical protein
LRSLAAIGTSLLKVNQVWGTLYRGHSVPTNSLNRHHYHVLDVTGDS